MGAWRLGDGRRRTEVQPVRGACKPAQYGGQLIVSRGDLHERGAGFVMPHVGGQDTHLCREVAQAPDSLFVVVPRRHAAPAPCDRQTAIWLNRSRNLPTFSALQRAWWRSTANAGGSCHRIVMDNGRDALEPGTRRQRPEFLFCW